MSRTQKENTLKSWSYSKYSCHKLCPFQFYCKYILKVPEEKGPALVRGIKIHELGEDYLNGVRRDVPEEYRKGVVHDAIKAIKKKKYVAEQDWAFNENWEQVPYRSKEAFLRMKIDAHGFPETSVIKLIDFKTGKVRDNYIEQLELYAIAAFSIYELSEAELELWYLDHGFITDEVVISVEQYDRLVKRWDRRVDKMFSDTKFRPRPNYLCKNYCSFAKHKSGHCKYGG